MSDESGKPVPQDEAAPEQAKKKGWDWKSIILQAIFFISLFLLVRSCQQPALTSGEMPNLQGHLLDGRPFAVEEYRGKPLLVHFWATWCNVCALEAESINNVAKDYAVLTIAAQSGTDEDIQRHLDKNQLSFPVFNDIDNSVTEQFGIKAFPTTLFVDGQGRISFVEAGLTSETGMRLRLWWAGL